MEEFIEKHGAIMDKYDPQKRVGLMVDEWGTGTTASRGETGRVIPAEHSSDAVVAGINLNIFNRHADRVQMANIAQMVNVLQAMILTDKEKMILTRPTTSSGCTKVHQGATLIPVELTAPEYKVDQASVPALSASASRDKEGRLHLSIVNLDPTAPPRSQLRLQARRLKVSQVKCSRLHG